MWMKLRDGLEHSAHRLSGADAASVAYAFAKADDHSGKLYQKLFRQLDEKRSDLQPLDCARASLGFLRGFAALSEQAITRGPVFDRVLELGLPNFDPEALSMLFDALGRSKPGTKGVDAMASLVLAEAYPRIHEFTVPQVASLARSLSHIQPDNEELLKGILDHACSAIVLFNNAGATVAPRHLAMILSGASEQRGRMEAADDWLRQLIPLVTQTLENGHCAPFTIVQFIVGLVHCPGLEATHALDKCTEKLTERLHSISAQ